MQPTLNTMDFVIIGAITFTLITVFRLVSSSESLRLHRCEKKIDIIMSHLGIDVLTKMSEVYGLSHAVIALVDQKKKVAAIKQHMDETGRSLRDSKQQIERYTNG